MNPIPHSTLRRSGRALLVSALALALAACASSRGLNPQGHVLDVDSLHSERTLADTDLSATGFPAQDWWKALGDAQLDALVAEGLAGHRAWTPPTRACARPRPRSAPHVPMSCPACRCPVAIPGCACLSRWQAARSVAITPAAARSPSTSAMAWTCGAASAPPGSRRGWRACGHRRGPGRTPEPVHRHHQAYADLAYAWQLNDVAEEELARSQKSLELTRQRRRAGIDSDLQVRQAEARVPAAQQQVQAAQQRIDAARTALAALVGKGPDRGLSIQRPQPLNPLALQLPGVLPSELLGRRPDIVAARWRVEAADKQIKVAKTRFYPSFNLTALAGVVAPNVGDLLKSSSTFAYIGPALSLPIFEGGKLRANLANTDAQYDLAVANYNQAVLDALRDVADQVNAVRSLAQQAHSQQQAVDTARSAFDLAQQRYRAGIGSYLDVLTAQSTLLQSQQQLAGLQSQQVQSSVRLSKALGGGFQPADADRAPIASHSDSSHS